MLWEACCCNCYGRGRSLLLPALCGKSCSAASRLPRNGVQLLGGFRGWTMPILPRSNMFFANESEKLQKIEQENIKMGQRWIKPVDPVDSDYRSPKPSKSSKFFLCGCCMLLCSGDWPLAQNLWRFESAALNTILDVAEVKAGERENKRANFTSNLMFIILTSTSTKETVHRSGCTVHAMICNDIQYTPALWSVPSGLSLWGLFSLVLQPSTGWAFRNGRKRARRQSIGSSKGVKPPVCGEKIIVASCKLHI